jgi:hypothetical protein
LQKAGFLRLSSLLGLRSRGPILAQTIRVRGEKVAGVRLRALREVPVGPLDHQDARAGVAGHVEDRDTGGECVRDERVPQRVRATSCQTGRFKRRIPLPRPPRVAADVAAPVAGNTSRVSSRGGTWSTASSARDVSGTRRRDRVVLPYGFMHPSVTTRSTSTAPASRSTSPRSEVDVSVTRPHIYAKETGDVGPGEAQAVLGLLTMLNTKRGSQAATALAYPLDRQPHLPAGEMLLRRADERR